MRMTHQQNKSDAPAKTFFSHNLVVFIPCTPSTCHDMHRTEHENRERGLRNRPGCRSRRVKKVVTIHWAAHRMPGRASRRRTSATWHAGDDDGSSTPREALQLDALQPLPSRAAPQPRDDALLPRYRDSEPPPDEAAAHGRTSPPQDAELARHAARRRADLAERLSKTLVNAPPLSRGVDYEWVERCQRAMRELAPDQLGGLTPDALWALFSRSRVERRLRGSAFFFEVGRDGVSHQADCTSTTHKVTVNKGR